VASENQYHVVEVKVHHLSKSVVAIVVQTTCFTQVVETIPVPLATKSALLTSIV